jgi:peptidoglycan/xylan/chitin deacetylase (PgdA/CDA1 family)
MKAAIELAMCRAAYHSGLLDVATRFIEPPARSRPQGTFQILVYHRVSAEGDRFVPAVSAVTFERYVKYLRDHFVVLSLTDLVAAAEEERIPARAIAITFDDGYEDTYLHACPILHRYNVPATVFLATGLMDSDDPMWNDAIGTVIRNTTCPVLDGVPGCAPLPLTTTQQRLQTLERTLEALKVYPPAERAELTRQIGRTLKVPVARGPRMLRWEQVREMHTHGIEFGAHTVNHPILTSIPEAEAAHEISESKRCIEERLQAPVAHFAYPNGRARDFDETTKRLVRQAGFSTAVSTLFGTNTATTDRYELRRGGPWEEDTSVFATKLWWYRWRNSCATRASAAERSA